MELQNVPNGVGQKVPKLSLPIGPKLCGPKKVEQRNRVDQKVGNGSGPKGPKRCGQTVCGPKGPKVVRAKRSQKISRGPKDPKCVVQNVVNGCGPNGPKWCGPKDPKIV